MNKLLIMCFALILSCTGTTAQKSNDMKANAEILASESQGGAEKAGFEILKDQQQLKNQITANFSKSGMEPVMEIPAFPKDKKVIVYHLGTFNSGDHKINEIKNVSVSNNILYVEVPEYQSGGMAIQVMSNPWFIFSVPSDYKFNSVELKYSK